MGECACVSVGARPYVWMYWLPVLWCVPVRACAPQSIKLAKGLQTGDTDRNIYFVPWARGCVRVCACVAVKPQHRSDPVSPVSSRFVKGESNFLISTKRKQGSTRALLNSVWII